MKICEDKKEVFRLLLTLLSGYNEPDIVKARFIRRLALRISRPGSIYLDDFDIALRDLEDYIELGFNTDIVKGIAIQAAEEMRLEQLVCGDVSSSEFT